MIRTTVQTSKSFNTIQKCLEILKVLIEESEKNGTAGLKSHNALLKSSILNLRIVTVKYNDIFIKVYENTTIWELKEILARKVNIVVDFIKIKIKGDYEITSNDHGCTIVSLGISDWESIFVDTNGNELKIPQKVLVKDGEVVPELIEIFKLWFEKFSTDGKMTKEDLARFTKLVIASKDNIDIYDHKVAGVFAKYDTDRDGFMDEDGFIRFYSDSTIAREAVVWENLKQYGIRNDLKFVNFFK